MLVIYITYDGQKVWVRKESNFGPLSYQESVLPLNYAPEQITLQSFCESRKIRIFLDHLTCRNTIFYHGKRKTAKKSSVKVVFVKPTSGGGILNLLQHMHQQLRQYLHV